VARGGSGGLTRTSPAISTTTHPLAGYSVPDHYMDTVESQNEWVAEVRKRLGMPEPRTTEATEEE
jgi:hypothetical protein